ncbi:MAG: flavin reductase family protein [Chloroflexi bacterium]|nr:flavin reductase family protein [Chloroflexota bacterium]
MVDKEAFRKAWSNFATGVTVITTIQPDGHVHGITANGVCSVSLEPPLVLACLGHNRNSYSLIKKRRRFAINILDESQQRIAEYYTRDSKDRFGDVEVAFRFTSQGSAIVEGGLAYMDCQVVAEHKAGDHTIFVAKVDEIGLKQGRPLLFFESGFHRLSSP